MDRRSITLGGADQVCDDAGGVWIVTGWVLGGLIYVGMVLALNAGFTTTVPFVVIPVVLLFMVGAGNLLSGKRPSRPAPRFNRPGPEPLTTSRQDDGGVAASEEAAETHAGPGPPDLGR